MEGGTYAVGHMKRLCYNLLGILKKYGMKSKEQLLRKKLLRSTGQAIADHKMIGELDRIMVCVSGGKDSFVLLELLRDLQRRAPVRFELLALGLNQGQPGFPEHVLSDYLSSLKMPFRIVKKDTYSIVKRILSEGETACSLCSRLRRGILYNIAVEEGYSKIALGHHADDILSTFLLNLFFEGSTWTMPPFLQSEDGRNTVIRPMAYCWESDIESFAALRNYPVIPRDLCGRREDLQRRRMHRLLDDLEKEIPNIRHSMLSALSKLHGSGNIDAGITEALNLWKNASGDSEGIPGALPSQTGRESPGSDA
jgi:tRNA 2-thiocytidine biosynthesis protein TtcA